MEVVTEILKYTAFYNMGYKYKIAILQTHHLGDIILATPAIKLLMENFPEAKITLITGSWNKDYIEDFPFLNKIIYFDNPFNDRRKYNIFHKIKTIFSFLREIRKERYDLIVELSGYFFSQYYLPFLKADYKIGQVNDPINAITFSSFIFDKKVISGRRKNEVQRDIDVIRKLKFKIRKAPPLWYPATSEDEDEITYLLKQNKIKGFVVIHAITPWKLRAWPKDKFAEVADWIIGNRNLDVIFIGSEDEKKKINEIIKLMRTKKRQKAHNFAGLVTIKQLAALLKKAKLFLGNDSGIAHLTATTDTPAIVLFGPGDEKRWGHKKHIIIRKNIDCYPCRQNLNRGRCVKGYKICKALQEISVERVIGRIKDIFKL
ncbi:MAG: glycosyltransferase family 9 protein [Candidatus Pacebacteria bacterium]|nr:glycosyltransferase family 9 protein [Candidatus Paceibacterota bacterium]